MSRVNQRRLDEPDLGGNAGSVRQFFPELRPEVLDHPRQTAQPDRPAPGAVVAGILGVPHGQRKASLALGMRETVIFWRVTLPQAMRTIIPPTTNQFISMLKDPSLISVMGVWEVMFLAQSYGHSSYRYIEMLTTAAVIYWVMSIGLELIQARMERHYEKVYLSRSEGRIAAFEHTRPLEPACWR